MFFQSIIGDVIVSVITVVAVICITIIGVIIDAFHSWTSSKSRVPDVVRSVNIACLVTIFGNSFSNLICMDTNFSGVVTIDRDGFVILRSRLTICSDFVVTY